MSQHFDTEPYRLAPSDLGEKAAEWSDKPHRLVYDLCREIERLQIIMLNSGLKEFLVPEEEPESGWDSAKRRIQEIQRRVKEK